MKLSGLLTSLRVQEVCSVTSRTFLRGGGAGVSVLGLLPAQHEAPPLCFVPAYKAVSALWCRFPPRSASAWLTSPSCRLLQTELRRALSPSSQVFCGAVTDHASARCLQTISCFCSSEWSALFTVWKAMLSDYSTVGLVLYAETRTETS